jgi:hypothetical protein
MEKDEMIRVRDGIWVVGKGLLVVSFKYASWKIVIPKKRMGERFGVLVRPEGEYNGEKEGEKEEEKVSHCGEGQTMCGWWPSPSEGEFHSKTPQIMSCSFCTCYFS